MKIALLADPIDSQKAGIHVYVRELIKAIDKSNPSNEYFLFRETKDKSIKNLKQIPLGPIGNSFQRLTRLFYTIPKKCVELKVDVVIELAHVGPFNLPRHIKRITAIHDLTPIFYPKWHNGISSFIQRMLLPGILRRANMIIANSRNTKKDLAKYDNKLEDKIEIIYPGVNPIFNPSSSKSELEKLHIGLDYFHFVGTIEPRKNLVTLLKAYEIFKHKSDSKTQLIIVGKKGWKTRSFYEQLQKHPFRPDIILTGFVPNEALRQIHSNSRALIFPSLYEGFGFPVLEAMACGSRVLSADNSSLPEVGGKLAKYFLANDEMALAELMLLCPSAGLTNDQKKENVLHTKKFSWESFVSQFEKSLLQLES